jgi:hypothetical protein
VTVLVDDAIWPWRGRRWAHLVSDESLAELHDLAHRIGMPYLAFQGDHYDVHEDLRLAAVGLGAVPTPARDLVRALRAAGLRHKRAVEPWRWDASGALHPRRADDALRRIRIDPAVVTTCVDALMEIGAAGTVRAGFREHEEIVVATQPATDVSLALGLERLSDRVLIHRAVGERGAFVEVVAAV